MQARNLRRFSRAVRLTTPAPSVLILCLILQGRVIYAGQPPALKSAEHKRLESDRVFSPPTRLDQLAALEERIQTLYRRLSPSTVALFDGKNGHQIGSGTVISKEGLVLTHGHHTLEPGMPVKVAFVDGQRAAGKFLGVHRVYDLSLVRIDGNGPWPAVSLGAPGDLQTGDNCVQLGFPMLYYRDGRAPLFRLGRFFGIEGNRLFTSCTSRGGDSGGPLFNLAGELVGVSGLMATSLDGPGHVSVDIYRKCRTELLESKLVVRETLIGPFRSTEGLAPLGHSVHRSVVTVLSPDKPVALGLIVGADGWIVTKSSELSDRVICQLADGRRLEATVAGRSWEHDLALLKVAAQDLSVARWSQRQPKPGTIVASVGPDAQPLSFGTVCSPILEVPREKGHLAFVVEDGRVGAVGLRIKDVWIEKPRTRAVLQDGDVLTHIDGTPMPSTAKEYWKVVGVLLNGPKAIVGERMELTIRRGEKVMNVQVPIESHSLIQEQFTPDLVGRRSGFPAAFIHDAHVRRIQNGSPVVDAQGNVCALNIATESLGPLGAGSGLTYAIPGDLVRKSVSELRRR